jgi:hypothetical protein
LRRCDNRHKTFVENNEAVEIKGWRASDGTLICVCPSMNAAPKRRSLCRCCESERGILADPHLGPVCSDCYADLTATRLTLDKIGPLVGVGACSSEVNR